MPGANSIPILSNPINSYPRIAPESAQKPKLLDRLREPLRPRHYSRRTEQAYRHWVKRFIYFHNLRHPAEMAGKESLFSVEKRLIVLLAPLRWWALTQKITKSSSESYSIVKEQSSWENGTIR